MNTVIFTIRKSRKQDFNVSVPPTFVTKFSNILESLNIKFCNCSRRRVSIINLYATYPNIHEACLTASMLLTPSPYNFLSAIEIDV